MNLTIGQYIITFIIIALSTKGLAHVTRELFVVIAQKLKGKTFLIFILISIGVILETLFLIYSFGYVVFWR